MNVNFVSKAGTVPSAKMFFDPGKDQDSPSKQTRQPLDSVIAEAVKKPSLPNFEGLPVYIRVMIYNYILITDADISLRSASEMRTQIGSSDDSKYGIPWQIWHWIGRTIPNGHFLCDFIDMNNGFPTNHAPQFTLLQNAAILLVSRRINQEATHIFCAKNNFHYSCMRAFPGATIDLLRTVPWPVPFSDRQLYFMRSLSLDYCNSHYNHWTDAAVNEIDNCIARNTSTLVKRVLHSRRSRYTFLQATAYNTIPWALGHGPRSSGTEQTSEAA